MHLRPLLGALTATALLASGCGGSSGDERAAATVPTATAPAEAAAVKAPTKREYVVAADRVCLDARKISQDANTAVRKAFAAHDAKGAAALIDHFGPDYARKIVEFQQLVRPEGDHAAIDELTAVMQAQVKALILEAGALRKGDDQKLAELTKAQQDAMTLADQLAGRYGFKVCGRAV